MLKILSIHRIRRSVCFSSIKHWRMSSTKRNWRSMKTRLRFGKSAIRRSRRWKRSLGIGSWSWLRRSRRLRICLRRRIWWCSIRNQSLFKRKESWAIFKTKMTKRSSWLQLWQMITIDLPSRFKSRRDPSSLWKKNSTTSEWKNTKVSPKEFSMVPTLTMHPFKKRTLSQCQPSLIPPLACLTL